MVAATLAAALLVTAIGCGGDDDNATGSGGPVAVGAWILNSASTNGTPIATPEDTLIFRSNYTGRYGSEVGWGWYEFRYQIRSDTLFQTRTDGQSSGQIDTSVIDFHSDTLFQAKRLSATEVSNRVWLRRTAN